MILKLLGRDDAQGITYHHHNVDTICCSSLMHEEHICDRHLADSLGETSGDASKDIGTPNISRGTHLGLPDSGSQTSSGTNKVAARTTISIHLMVENIV